MSKPVPEIHPYMVASLAVLMRARQLHPFVRIDELLRVWALALGAAFLLLSLWKRLLGNRSAKAALATSLCLGFLGFFADFAHTVQVTAGFFGWVKFGRMRYSSGMACIMFGFLCWRLIRTSRKLVLGRQYLSVALTLMVVFTLMQNIFAFATRLPVPANKSPLGQAPLVPSRNPAPDIYYILMDAYTSSESLREFWGYDNSPFLDFLRAHGFQVVTNARANYNRTTYSMSASLNMEYPQPLPELSPFARVESLCGTIQAAEVPRQLQASGYRLINLSLFNVLDQPRFYKFMLTGHRSLAELLFDGSIFGHLLRYSPSVFWGRPNLKIFTKLAEIPAESAAAPRFVYAHLMMPHAPFIFDRRGRTLWLRARELNKENYLEQLIYANQLLTNTVTAILAKSKMPPLIIIQGDHGVRWVLGKDGAPEETTILNAYYLPNGKPDWIYPGITPVNTFRMVFNRYFGASYPYLPDRQFDTPEASEGD